MMIPLDGWVSGKKHSFKSTLANGCGNCGSKKGFHRKRWRLPASLTVHTSAASSAVKEISAYSTFTELLTLSA